MFQIALVTNHDDWEVILVLHTEDLLLERENFLKALSACYAVDEEKAFACTHVLFAHGAVFFLACCVEDVKKSDFIVDEALLAV
jgi:hypothetical protein